MAIHRGVNAPPDPDLAVRRMAAVVAVAIWLVIYGLPLVSIVQRSLAGVAGRAGLSPSTFVEVFTDGRLGRLALFGLGQTLVSTAVVVVAGVPIGWVVGRLEFGGRNAMSTLVMTPFVLPTLSVALAVTSLGGDLPESTVGRVLLIVAAHGVFNLGIMVRGVAHAVAVTPPSGEEAARVLGRRKAIAAMVTSVRAAGPAIASTALIVAMFCLTSFGIVVALGGAHLSTIEVEVWVLTTRSLDLARAAVLVVMQLVVVLALIGWYQRIRPSASVRVPFARRRPEGTAERSAVIGAWLVVGAVSAGPLVALVWRSLHDTMGWTLDNYRGLPLDAIGRTVLWALAATVIAMAIAAPVAVAASSLDRLGRWCESAMMIPFAMSAATLGLGYLLGFGGSVIDLRGTWLIIALVQAAGAAPVAVRIVLAALRGVDRGQLEAAAACGAGVARRYREVVWPAVRGAFGVAVGFAFAMSVGEFGATVFLARQDSPTVSVIIGRLLGRPGAGGAGHALALGVVLAAISAGGLWLVDRGSRTTQTI